MIEIYTDGGCSGNPGPGGWAYVIIQTIDMENGQGKGTAQSESESPAPLAEKWGAEKSTTNNRMELMAVISALEALPSLCSESLAGNEKITVYTDSQYVQKGITIWIKDWKTRGWRTSGKDPVKNQDLWQRLDALTAGFSITWIWIKGHAGNEFNEHCDKLTQKAIASL